MPGTTAETVADEECTDEDRNSEGSERANGADGEDGTDSQGAAEHEQSQSNSDNGVHPDSVDRCLGRLVDASPEAREGEAAVASVGESHTRCSNHAALTHEEAADDCEHEDGDSDFLGKTLKEVCGPGLAQVAVNSASDIDDGVGCHQVECEAADAAEGRGHDDSARSRDVGVGAFFGQVEGCVIAGHSPDDADEGHEDRDAVGPFSLIGDLAPDFSGVVEARETSALTVAGGRNNDDDDD